MKRQRTLQEEIHDYLTYSDGNIVYHDFWFLDSLYGKYGYEAVKKELMKQEQEKSN